jgi:hypothetical protein
VGYKRDDVAVINAMRCYLDGNPTPTPKQMDICFPYTSRDIRRIQPKLCAALGRSAFYHLTGMSQDEFPFYLGKVIFSKKVRKKVLVTYHPAATLYDVTKYETFESHIRAIPKLMDAEPFETKHSVYAYLETTEQWEDYKKQIYKADYIYLDSEATGLNMFDGDRLTLLQIGTGEEPILLFDPKLVYKIKDELRFILESKYIIGQGFEFDAKLLDVEHGIFFNNFYHDTCIAEFCISGMKNNDLNYLTGKYNPDMYGYWRAVKSVGGAHNVTDKSVLHQYGSDDVHTMHIIERKQMKELARQGLDTVFYDIIMPCNKVLTKMSIRGVLYDIEELDKVDAAYKKKAERLLIKTTDVKGIAECERKFNAKFNPRSSIS